MNTIGGYLSLELRRGEHFHRNALQLNTARNAFEFVLRVRQYKMVYIPFYTYDVMLQPLKLLGVRYKYYRINGDLEPVDLPFLNGDEAFLYTNYFGLKQQCVERLATHYGKQLIVDNAQAFYAKALEGIDTFYSARKFFGVPDGAYLYTDGKLDCDFNYDNSFGRCTHLLKRIDQGAEAAFEDFRTSEADLDNQPILRMSSLTESLMASIDYGIVRERRIGNYKILDSALSDTNCLHFQLNEKSVPMVYPYLTNNPLMKKRLIESRLFVATYWPNVLKWCKKGEWEHSIAQDACFLPIDQRYGKNDMMSVLRIIKSCNK